MTQHVVRTAAACFYHIRRLRQIRRQVGQEVTQQLVLALIMSRPDYSNIASRTANVHNGATAARPECSRPISVRSGSLQPRHADPNPAALVAGQLHNKVQAMLPHPCDTLRSQPDLSDTNRPVSQRQ